MLGHTWVERNDADYWQRPYHFGETHKSLLNKNFCGSVWRANFCPDRVTRDFFPELIHHLFTGTAASRCDIAKAR